MGSPLWDQMWAVVEEQAPTVVEMGYRADQGDASAFFAARGFQKWFARDLMQYSGPWFPELAVDVVTLEPRRVTGYMLAVNECFWPLREALDIKPYAPFPDTAFSDQLQRRLLEAGESTFLFLEDGKLAGSGAIEGPDFVDLVAVRPGYRRLGLGRSITQFCVNRLRRRGAQDVYTSVLEINTGARLLYEGLGLDLVEPYEEARLWLARGTS
ncbi:MAG: GNAT family N-acetyltransferase [Bacillota bacterium]